MEDAGESGSTEPPRTQRPWLGLRTSLVLKGLSLLLTSSRRWRRDWGSVRFPETVEEGSATMSEVMSPATDVAAQILWAVGQPAHVNLDMIHVMPTCQGGATRIHRSPQMRRPQ